MENSVETEKNVAVRIDSYSKQLTTLKRNDSALQLNLLKEIENLLLEDSFSTDFQSILEVLHKPLLLNLKNSTEKCKEISLKVLQFLFGRVSCVETFLPIVIATLVHLIGISDEREASEEIRLLEVQLLMIILEQYDGNLVKYFSDITHILSKCIIDDCPEVKRRSCECVSLVAIKYKTNFHMVSGSLINSLLKTVSHQHLKTRTVCVQAIGSVIQYGNSGDFKNVITHLAQRMFDRSPAVRIAVVETIGGWLVNLDDRYSYFQRLIPLMLSALYDDIQDIRSVAKDLWCKAGQQYLEENEKDYKDMIQYSKPELEDYPISGSRPTLGCRLLVQRHFYVIVPALLNDINDWVPDTRVKSAKVMHSLILHAEEKATIKLVSLIDAIVSAAKDEEPEVVFEAISSAELLGYFIEVKLLCDNVLSLLHASPTQVNLSILAAVTRGHKRSMPPECFKAICQVLSDPSVCRLKTSIEQANLLLCVDALFFSADKIDSDTSYQLFTILVSVAGLTTNSSVLTKATELLDQFAAFQVCSLSILYKKHSLPFLQELTLKSEIWTYHNPEMPIFSFLMQSEHMEEQELSFMIPILITNLKPTKEAKMRSHLLTIICQVVRGFSQDKNERLSRSIFTLVHEGVLPNLTWAAGKTSAALRTIAVASLYEIINKNCLPSKMIGEIGDDLLPFLTTLSDDDVTANRLFSCKVMNCILPTLPEFVDELKIHKACQEFLQCMDDESDEIRIETTKLFQTYFKSFAVGYNWSMYNAYLKQLFKNFLIHMDDRNENIRKLVLDMLKDAAMIAPGMLIEEVESTKDTMNSGDLCDELMDYVKNIKINNG